MEKDIIKEFEEMMGKVPEMKVNGETTCFVCGQPYNKSPQMEKLKSFILSAVSQAKEEGRKQGVEEERKRFLASNDIENMVNTAFIKGQFDAKEKKWWQFWK